MPWQLESSEQALQRAPRVRPGDTRRGMEPDARRLQIMSAAGRAGQSRQPDKPDKPGEPGQQGESGGPSRPGEPSQPAGRPRDGRT